MCRLIRVHQRNLSAICTIFLTERREIFAPEFAGHDMQVEDHWDHAKFQPKPGPWGVPKETLWNFNRTAIPQGVPTLDLSEKFPIALKMNRHALGLWVSSSPHSLQCEIYQSKPNLGTRWQKPQLRIHRSVCCFCAWCVPHRRSICCGHAWGEPKLSGFACRFYIYCRSYTLLSCDLYSVTG